MASGIPLGRAFVTVTLDRSEFDRGVRGLGNARGLESVGTALGTRTGRGFGTSLRKSSLAALTGLGPMLLGATGLAGAVAGIAKIGMQYEDNLNIFQAVTRATGVQMGLVAAKARELGADVKLPGVSAAGAASAMTELAKAGLTVQQSMDSARASLQLARASGMSEAESANIAANALNVFGLKARDLTSVVDQLAATANSSSVEMRDVSDSFKMAASVFAGFQAPAVGSKEAIIELNTAIGILGNAGIKGSDAGTSLKQMLLQLTGPTKQAKSLMELLAYKARSASISLSEQTAVLHGDVKERSVALAEIVKHNKALKDTGDIAFTAAGKMRSLPEIIDMVSKGTRGMTQEEKAYTITQIFGADASRAILALMKGGLPVYEAMRQAVLRQGAAADVARAKNIGLRGAFDNLKSQLENAAISIYNVVKGPLTSAVNGLAGSLQPLAVQIASFGSFVQRNSGTFRDLAVALGLVTAALLTYKATLAVVLVTQRAWIALQGVIAFVQLAAGVRSFAAAWALLDAAMAANPIGLVVVAIGALVAGIIYAWKHSETFRNVVLAVWGAIKVAVKATIDWITGTAWPALKVAWNAIATAALWLWHNIIQPVWEGIKTAISVVITAVVGYVKFWIGVYKGVAAVAMWLWHNIIEPVWAGIHKAIQIAWLLIQVIFKALSNIIVNEVGQKIQWLRTIWNAVFDYISAKVKWWWGGVQVIFAALRQYIFGPISASITWLNNKFAAVFNFIGQVVAAWWNLHVKPYLDAAKLGWKILGDYLSGVWTYKIKPFIDAFAYTVKNLLPRAFQLGVDTIKTEWGKVQDAAKKPITFVVNSVINPFIRGLNAAAGMVGVKGRVSEIRGFATGGEFSGGRISGAPSPFDNRIAPAIVPGVGAVKLGGGEFIVRSSMASKARGLLEWINAGMRQGPSGAASRIGRPMVDMPGDGSEGFAFADGGLVGWVKDVWGAVTNPTETIKKPFQEAMSRVPGSGLIKDFLLGAANRLLNGAVSWITSFGTGVGGTLKMVAANAFLRSQNGKPYVWASAGPGGYDCSGIVSAVYNIMHGKNPYSHTFSTSNAGSFFPKPGPNGPLVAAWSHPGQSPASASVGHMMGRVGNLTFESSGSRGVHLGNTTRNLTDFANIGHYAGGGYLPFGSYDTGGYLPKGLSLAYNGTGRPEPVGGGNTYQITVNVAPGTHPAEVGRQVIESIKAYERGNGKGWRA